MSSIITNGSSIVALQTLRAVNANLTSTQQNVASGLRVSKASDNAAYWSIATTMRSDSKAVSAVSDALSMGAAKVDTAYAGMDAVVDVLGAFKAKLVAAKEDGVDKAKIQTDLDQLKKQVVSIANAASFSGENWLNTDVADIIDNENNSASVVSSFTRNSNGTVAVNQTDIHLSKTSLFNSTGGGILQHDPRDMESIGGMRLGYHQPDGTTDWSSSNTNWTQEAGFTFDFSGPITFDDPGDEISFEVTVDADNPADNLPGPQETGKETPITINRATVDAVYPSLNGVISTYQQYIRVLDYALGAAGSDASASEVRDYENKIIPDRIAISTNENRANGLNGSYVQVSGASNTTDTRGGLVDNSAYSRRASTLILNFNGFQDFKDGGTAEGVTVSFNFSVNGAPQKSYSFDRKYVNDLLGKDTGLVETADEMVTVLQSLMSADWPDLIIESNSATNVTLRTDPNVDRRAGSDTSIGFTSINVSIEPIPKLDFLDIDVAQFPDATDSYIEYIESASRRAIEGASVLGALQSRIDMQTEFAARMISTIDSGVGRLVDADMEEESSRLAAQQTQQQLAIQSLSIANNMPQSVLSLFGG
jgi:flagellin